MSDDQEHQAAEEAWDAAQQLRARIDSGELTEAEVLQLQYSEVEEDDEDAEDVITPTQQFIIEHLRASGGSADINDLVNGYHGSTLTEFDRRHARIRQALARLAWPHQYGIKTPAVISVELPTDRIYGAVRLKEKVGEQQ